MSAPAPLLGHRRALDQIFEAGFLSVPWAAALAIASVAAVLLLGPATAVVLLVGALAMLALIRYLPEAFLGLLMISGPLSSTTYAASAPLSFTTAGLLGVGASVLYRAARHRTARFRLPLTVIPFVLLSALLLAASFHSPDPGGGFTKSLTFETVTAVAFFAPLVLIDGRRSLIRFAIVLTTIGVWVALVSEKTGHDSHPLVLPGSDNEIVVGQFAGLGLLAILAVLWPLTPGLWRLLWVPPAAIMVPTLVGAGSRGALLGTAVALAIALPLLLRNRETRLAAIAIVLAVVVAAPSVWAASPPAARAKYLATFQLGQGAETLDAGGGQRKEILSLAVDLFRQHPMGVGTDGYHALTGYEWPHNIILELGAEVGVAGIVLFLLILAGVAAGITPAIRRGSTEAVGAVAFAAAPLVLAMSSFDLNNNRVLWLMLGVAMASGRLSLVRGASGLEAREPTRPPMSLSVPVPPSAFTSPPPRRARMPRRARRPTTVATGRPASVVAGGVESLLFRVGEALLGVVLVIITARFMAPEGRGLFALSSLVALLCVLPLGPVWSASAIEVARGRVPLPQLAGALAGIAVIGGLTTGAIALGAALVIDEHLWVIAFPAAIAPLLLVARYQEGLFQGLGRVRAVNQMHLARAALPVALMTPLLALGADDRSVVGAWTVSLAALPLLFAVPVLREIGGIALPRSPGLVRRLTKAGAQLVIANSVVLLNTRLALLFLAVFATTAEVGVYSVAVAAAEVVYLASFALMSSTFRSIGGGTPGESLRVTIRALRHALLLHVAGCAVLVPLLYVALPSIVGDGFGGVPRVLLIMAPGLVAQSGFWVLHTYFTVQLARPTTIARVAVVALAANAAIAAALVPSLGMDGAAIAASIANIASAAFAVRTFCAGTRTPLRALLPGSAEFRDYADLASSIAGRAGKVTTP